jgi:DinB family protein
MLLENMTDADFKRAFHHPENGIMPLDPTVEMYAWHGRHHVAHIQALRGRMGWLVS